MTVDQRPGIVGATAGVSPQETPRPQLNGIDQALNHGIRLHGFRSGGGLRVISLELEGKTVGYGEHFSVDVALVHADEDFLAGGRKYQEVYGKLYPHYLTGSHEVTSPLDGWLLQGHTIDAFKKAEGLIRVELKGLKETETPQDVLDQAKALRRPIAWKDRGYTYKTTYDPHLYPNGDGGHSTKVIGVPEGKTERRSGPWIYPRVKAGEGRNFNEALDRAFASQDVEIDKL